MFPSVFSSLSGSLLHVMMIIRQYTLCLEHHQAILYVFGSSSGSLPHVWVIVSLAVCSYSSLDHCQAVLLHVWYIIRKFTTCLDHQAVWYMFWSLWGSFAICWDRHQTVRYVLGSSSGIIHVWVIRQFAACFYLGLDHRQAVSYMFGSSSGSLLHVWIIIRQFLNVTCYWIVLM
jgi:hypothetical protein